MSTQHTPGPRYVDSTHDGHYVRANGGEDTIALCESEDVARDIVAAFNDRHDMLAVLIDCANALGELLPSDHPRRAVLARANAVIANAKAQS